MLPNGLPIMKIDNGITFSLWSLHIAYVCYAVQEHVNCMEILSTCSSTGLLKRDVTFVSFLAQLEC